MLAYRKDFGLHQLNVLGLAEAQKMITRGFYTTATNFSTDRFGYDNLQAGAVRLWEGTGSYYEAPHLASFLGRVNYIYDGKYIATVNARADASSKVGPIINGVFPFGFCRLGVDRRGVYGRCLVGKEFKDSFGIWPIR